MWTRYFGGPKKLKPDLGPEFDNTFVDQLRDTLGCEIVPVPGGAHWSHGTTENKHGVLREMAQRMIDDNPGLNPEEAMDACVTAKKMHCECLWLQSFSVGVWVCAYDPLFSGEGR